MNKMKLIRSWTVALCAVMAIALLSGCTGNATANTGNTSGSATSSAAEQQPKTRFTINEQATLNDVAVTLTSVTESSGAAFLEPEAGNIFVICEFDIANNSDSEISISSLMSFEAYVDDYSTSLSISALAATDKTQLDGSVAAGKKMNGVIGYEVPKDWQELEITFTPDIFSSKTIEFYATNS